MTSFSYKDSRSATSAITGNDQLFIQSYSYLYVTPGVATAKNGASIVKYAATCNGVTYSNTTGAALNLYGVAKSGTVDVVVTATDSRGYTVSSTQQITVIPYAKPKVSSSTSSTSTTVAATASAVKAAYDRNSWDSISLDTALAIADGGTGATTAASARTNLGITATSLYNGTLSSGSTGSA